MSVHRGAERRPAPASTSSELFAVLTAFVGARLEHRSSAARLDDVELVALGIGQGRPPGTTLVEIGDAGGAEAGEAFELGVEVGRGEVDVNPVLPRFGSGTLTNIHDADVLLVIVAKSGLAPASTVSSSTLDQKPATRAASAQSKVMWLRVTVIEGLLHSLDVRRADVEGRLALIGQQTSVRWSAGSTSAPATT